MPAPRKRTPTRSKQSPDALGILVLRVTLRYVEPTVWREISVPDFFTLNQLHRVLQCSFAWMDYHLHEFQIRRERFVPRESEIAGTDTARTTLASLGLKRGSQFVYAYDYGDGWEHDLEVVTVTRETIDPHAIPMPRILDGQRAAPPEDCGGPPGYARLQDALMDPDHPDHGQAHHWVPRGFDPAIFDLPSADHGLVLACAWGAI
jgi:hypothetical protein